MFRLATCHDFIAMKEKYTEYANPVEENSWGLKENGSLFVVDHILKNKPHRIIEVGAGLRFFLCRKFCRQSDFWSIDSGDLYPDPDKFNKKISHFSQKHKLTFINGLMGDFSPKLPDNYFDFLFSVSALEHTPREPKDLFEKVSQDMFRVLKPGGYMFHSIDVVPSNDKPELFRKAFLDAGFVFVEEPQELDWNVGSRDNQILLEMLRTVHLNYNRKQRENNIPIKWYHFGSVLVLAQKPE